MAHDFKKLSTNSAFPNLDSVEVYKYDNQFDYTRYDYTQMELMLCSVPWDMGEAHIGNRTISGIGNVVYFGTKAKRDAWFAAIPDSECLRFSTKYKELHRDLTIDVPVPFDVCARYNYLTVHYSLFANDDSPVMFEDDNGARDWFWFVREVEFVAPNTTRLHLLDDAFQTWIYDVDITGMVLERGHAPMFAIKTDEYLSNPIDNNEYLLTEDVNFGSISQVKHIDVLQLNAGNMYACIATSANPRVSWGSKAADDWKTPAGASYTANGNPSFFVFALPVSQLATFLANVTSNYPQFKQTVQGVFFASDDLITIGQSFTFADVECYMVSSSRKRFDFMQLTKAQFGYATRYADIAKLYTSPYAHIEVTDENGNVDVVRVEDTNGTLDVSAALSLAYPFVTIDAHLLGAGGIVGASITYRNVTAHTFNVSGQWYETLRTWNVPTFAVVLDAAKEYDYSIHFDRLQRVNDYEKAYANASASAVNAKTNRDASAMAARDNAYNSADTALANADASADTVKSNADASATTAKANADASATTAKANVATIAKANKSNTDDAADTAETNAYTMAAANKANAYDSAATASTNTKNIANANKLNADASADLVTDNATLTTTANNAVRDASNSSADRSYTATNAYNFGIMDADNAIISASATSQIDAENEQAAVSMASGAASSAVGAISSLATGDIAGAATSAINGIIGGASTLASTNISVRLKSAEATIAQTSNEYHAEESTEKSQSDTANQKTTTTTLTAVQNTLTTGQAANSSATTKANALRSKNAQDAAADASEVTGKSNADRTKTAEETAATATKTTTKANATRTQKAENEAAAATETTTKANAKRTYDTAIANNAATNTATKANAKRTYDTAIANNAATNTATKANAKRTYDTEIANNAATNTTTKANATRNNVIERANALNTYNTTTANNERDYNTSIANAGRDKTNAQRDIENDVLQAALRAPFVYGEFANGESSANKPIALFANVVTQSKSAISSAGDEFLRYGYMLDKFWDFDGDWNVGKYFTYWKLRDFWVSNLNVPDMYMDKLRFFLFGGVTIWRAPEYIGNVSIYDNYNLGVSNAQLH